jgi:hypothetical protein
MRIKAYKSVFMALLKDYTFYKLSCIDTDVELEYVGSTTNMKSRNDSHRRSCNNTNNPKYNYKVYNTIRENGGWKNWKMVELDKIFQISKRDAEMREEELRKQLRVSLNSQRCFITDEERRQYQTNSLRERRHKNPDLFNKKQREYREKNKDEINEKAREYREKNKERINQQQRERRAKKKLDLDH